MLSDRKETEIIGSKSYKGKRLLPAQGIWQNFKKEGIYERTTEIWIKCGQLKALVKKGTLVKRPTVTKATQNSGKAWRICKNRLVLPEIQHPLLQDRLGPDWGRPCTHTECGLQYHPHRGPPMCPRSPSG